MAKHIQARWLPMIAAAWLLAGGWLWGHANDQARILELRREIARHDELYYRKAAPEISDAAYDVLKAELRRLEQAYPDFGDIVAGAAAGGKVGDDRTEGFAKRRHGAPMLSLDKAYSDEELSAFWARATGTLGRNEVAWRVEPKFDGIAVSLVYEHGRLARAVTRGDGAEGDDITVNVRALCAPPEVLAGKAPALIEIRGEIYLGLEEFAHINREREAAGEPVFAHPRNLAAGSVKALDPATNAGRRLSLVCYAWGAVEPASERPASLGKFAGQLHAWGLPAVEGARTGAGWPDLRAAVESLRDERARLGFPTDGVVVKLELTADQERLGLGPAAPRWAIARKFPAERAATRLTGITWQVGRTGVLTPVAELVPVVLGGTTVARAGLHNAAEIIALDLRTGDTVWVEKAGEIIPDIVGVDRSRRAEDATPWAPPEVCPACDGEVTSEANEAVDEGRVGRLRCTNDACPAVLARRVEWFASKGGVDIAGLGPATIAALVENERVRGLADLYRLGHADLLALPGVGERSAEKLLAAITASKDAPWPAVLGGLGLPGVGAGRAEALAKAVPDWAALLSADRAALVAAGLGDGVADAVAAHLARPAVRAELAALAEFGVGTVRGEATSNAGAFAGETVVLTGRLQRWTRAEATRRLEAAGARVEPDVTRRTTLVVAGEDAGAKLAAARGLGIAVIDEAALADRLGAAK